MIYFILFFCTILIFNISQTKNGELIVKKTKKSHISFFIALWLLFGLRHHTVLGDATTYAQQFSGGDFKWNGLFNLFMNEKEPLFVLVRNVTRIFTQNYTIYFFVTSLPIVAGLTYLMKEYADNTFLSTLIMCVLGITTFAFAGIRQAMAMGVCCFAIKYIKEGKLIPFLLIVFIASGFHKMAWLFLAAYPISKIKCGYYWWAIVVLFFILGLTRSPIIGTIGKFFVGEDEYFSNYFEEDRGGLNLTLFIIQLLLIIVSYFYKKQMVNDDKRYNMLFNLAFVGVCFQALTPIVGEFFRASLFFSIFICFIVPKAITYEKNGKLKLVMKITLIGVSLLYLFIISDITKSYMLCWGI